MSDFISRAEAIEAIRKQLNDTNAMVDVIRWKGVDPTAPIIHLISAISVLPSADVVSRDDLIKAYEKGLQAQVVDLTERRPTGEWTDNHNGTFTCDQCGCKHSKSNYCPNCGAEMGVNK